MAKEPGEKPTVADIDLSLIKNMDAVNVKDKTFESDVILKAVAEKSKKGKGKFNFTEAETIPLPSGGAIYSDVTEDEDVLKGFIKMYPMGMKEEEILSTTRFIKSGSTTRIILDRCIASEIDSSDLLMFDSNFLMYYLRSISYGDDYTFGLTCENSMCEKKFKHTVKISELTFEELPKDFEEPIEVKLPVSKYTVLSKLPRQSINYNC